MKMRHLASLALFLTAALAAPSPVQITITDPSKGFDVGPYARTRFDLIESYNPLATASVAKGSDLNRKKVRAGGVKSVSRKPTEDSDLLGNSVEGVEKLETVLPSESVRGEWLEWTSWSPCSNGERSRIRACVAKRAARRIVCDGPSKETETCLSFSLDENNTPVAADPWSIEREISGVYPKARGSSSI